MSHYKSAVALLSLIVLVAVGSGCSSDENSIFGGNAAYLVIYEGISSTTGDIGSRAETDAICADAAPDFANAANAHAFLGYGASDSLGALAANSNYEEFWPVASVIGTQLATSWAGLFDENIEFSLSATEVTDSLYWTGSYPDGSSDFNCDNWADGTAGENGNVGDPEQTDAEFLSFDTINCDSTAAMLCVAPVEILSPINPD